MSAIPRDFEPEPPSRSPDRPVDPDLGWALDICVLVDVQLDQARFTLGAAPSFLANLWVVRRLAERVARSQERSSGRTPNLLMVEGDLDRLTDHLNWAVTLCNAGLKERTREQIAGALHSARLALETLNSAERATPKDDPISQWLRPSRPDWL